MPHAEKVSYTEKFSYEAGIEGDYWLSPQKTMQD